MINVNGMKFEERKEKWPRVDHPRWYGEIDGFHIVISWDYDQCYDFSHYGEFCEEKDIGRKDFALRNPNLWAKRDLGNGTDSWVRVSRNEYGWFKLTNHPKDEVEWYMKNENMTEGQAWQKVLDRERATLRKIVRDEIYAIVVTVRVSREGVELGRASCGGYEMESYVKDSDIADALADGNLVQEALDEAKTTLKHLCTCH